ncbi:S8 family peptidase [Novosphingobium sp. ZN18A2]|uniref:S8 family peptidase n=1 Tax=Novosphingobium sp. ZN18A2 TaxID=3079861 RepID=UPI0030CAD40C
MSGYEPGRPMMRRRAACLASVTALIAALSACGGGGGVNSTPAPVPTPTPTPTPTPAPTPTPTPSPTPTSFNTAEYRRSDGPVYHNAITAWQDGATGAGVKLAIVDTGINTSNTEFAGRISPDSRDVVANRGIQDEDDHGNMVALVAAAARNDSGIMGIAYNATIQVLRADAVGSCATADPNNPDSGCSFNDTDIAAGINAAVTGGARVINLSLGGSTASLNVRQAVAQAAAAGVVVIVSAGNEGDSTDPTVDPNNPDPFATDVRNAGGGNVIIAGSVDDTGTISAFSNRAGSQQNWFLAALGEGVCCVYSGSQIEVTTTNGQQYVTVVNGTSFAAPQITGAVALLAQAFPNLTGAQIVDLLLKTARDAGAAGTDGIYGRGILDIANAFAPQGTTSIAGTKVALPLGDTVAVTGPAMGDAVNGQTLGAIVLDGYSRAYAVDFARSLQAARVDPKLYGALSTASRNVSMGNGAMSMAFSVDARHFAGAAPLRLAPEQADRARVLAATVTARIAPDRQIGFSFSQGASGLVASMQGQTGPAFLIAGDAQGAAAFHESDDSAFAIRQRIGRWGLTVSADRGRVVTSPANFGADWLRRTDREPFSRISVSADRRFGSLDTVTGITLLREDRTMLGARLHNALGGGGATSLFVNTALGWQFAPSWRLGASGRFGWTHPDRSATVVSGSQMLTSAWSADIAKTGVFAAHDSLALRVSQPLRVERGGLNLDLPQSWSYATGTAGYGIERLSLSPTGREMTGELAWRTDLWDGALATSLFYRKDPGHYVSLPDDKGVAVRWWRSF